MRQQVLVLFFFRCSLRNQKPRFVLGSREAAVSLPCVSTRMSILVVSNTCNLAFSPLKQLQISISDSGQCARSQNKENFMQQLYIVYLYAAVCFVLCQLNCQMLDICFWEHFNVVLWRQHLNYFKFAYNQKTCVKLELSKKKLMFKAWCKSSGRAITL